MQIDYNNLSSLPEDGSVYNELQYHVDDDDDDKDLNEDEYSGRDDVGPEQGNASGPFRDDDDYDINESHVNINPA